VSGFTSTIPITRASANATMKRALGREQPTVEAGETPAKCPHEHLDMDGICKTCGEDCRGIH
jgi:hypothetical protein